MKKLIILITILILPSVLFAASLEYPSIVRSTKALGMGDAYYAMGEDQYALFYNPAGLARIDKSRWSILNLQIGANDNLMDNKNAYSDTDWDDESEVADFLRDIIGKHQNFNGTFFPAYYKKNFSLGVFASAQVTGIARNKVFPELDADAVIDYGIIGGISRSFMSDKLDVGVSVILMNRRSLSETYSVADIASDEFDEIIEDDLEEGTGLLANVGVIYNITPKNTSNLRVGAAINNIGTTSMGDAKDLETTFNLSVAYSPKFGPFSTDFVADFRDVLQANDQDSDIAKRVNLGAQAKWKALALRTGIHQGYFTAGFGVDLRYVTLDYAYYQEELGAYAGQLEDERHVLTLSLGF